MKLISAEEIRRTLDWSSTVEALKQAFQQGCEMPTRHLHSMSNDPDAPIHLLMPAWVTDRYLGVKAVNIFPGNTQIGKPSVSGVYLLFSAQTGEALAVLEGGELTMRRTAAASALAARYLARENACRLLIVGTGSLSRRLALAHAAVRPIRHVTVWGRNLEKAAVVADELCREGLQSEVAMDLEASVEVADIVSCATLSATPLIRGSWLRPGVHLDLVGSFTPSMREADDEVIRRSRVFVDTRGAAMRESGDILVPLQKGILSDKDIRGDLFCLTRGTCPGRISQDEITLFKSVGVAIEDLAAASLVYERGGASKV